jgi:uroporphyrinogen-III synthase
MMKTILSTRELTAPQRDLLLGAGVGLVQYNAIHTLPIEFDLPSGTDHFIFTSGRAVDVFFQHPRNDLKGAKCFCVGERTASKLAEKGQKVIEIAQNGQELGEKLAKSYQTAKFIYVCGKQRLDTLPDLLLNKDITFTELPVYRTEGTFKKFDRSFDAVMLFSPSGVRSYCKVNDPADAWLVCIGDTTAKAAKDFSQKVMVANSTRIESVIAKAVNTLKL